MHAKQLDNQREISVHRRGRLALVLLVGLACFSLLTWLIFSPNITESLGKSRVFPFGVALLSLVPLYPLYRLAKKWPRFSVAIALLVAGLVLTLIFVIAEYALHIENEWVHDLLNVSEILFLLCSILFVWKAKA
jgi:hypothetical protein